MFDDLISFALYIAGCIVSAAITIFLISSLWCSTAGPAACFEFGEGMKLQTQYKFWSGCFVQMPDGRTLPESIAKDVMRQEYRVELKK